jgi:hypothetical protein
MSEIWIMFLKQLLLTLFISLCSLFFSQEKSFEIKSPKVFVTKEVSFSYSNLEIFHSLSIAKIVSKFDFGIGVGLGIKSTYFQRCFMPLLKTECGFNFLKIENPSSKKQLYLGPLFQVSSAFQKIVTTHTFCSAQLGYRLMIGNKFRFYNAFTIGPFVESFKGEKNNRMDAWTLSTNFSIGLTYALY